MTYQMNRALSYYTLSGLSWRRSRVRACCNVKFVCACVLLSAAVSPSFAEDWPNFRGPRHDGISLETGFRKAWDKSLPLVWDREVGDSFSSFACVGEQVYTCGSKDGKQVLICLNAKDGGVRWEKPFEEQYRDAQGGDGTRATPTVNDGLVYVLGGHGTLLCVNADDGSEVWRHKFSNPPQWGYSGSVLVEGDLAISSGGGSDGALVAFDKKTGRQVYKCGDDPAGYATPYPFTFGGVRYVAGFTGNSILIADAKTGREVWRHSWKTDWDVNAAAPIFHDGYLFVSSGYHTGCGLFKLRRDGNRLAGDEVWRNRTLMNKFQSCILFEGKLYASDQKALVCADFMTGKEMWRKHHVRHGTVVLADHHLLLLTADGKLRIAPVSTDGFNPVTDADLLSGRCWTVPVLHNGRLYVRNMTRIACFDLRG